MSTGRHLVVLSVCIALLFVVTRVFPLSAGGPGTIDFIQYWSAWRLMQQGANPYDPQLLTQLQSSLTGDSEHLILSWNPPWTFVALSPVLSLPFGQAASIWLALQIGLILVISVTLPRGLGKHVPSPLVCVLASTLFFPILNSIKMGQLGVLFAAGIALFLYYQRAGAFFLAGLSLLPLTFKPHLFFLFIVPGVMWLKQLTFRERVHFLAGSLGSFSVLLLACAAVSHSGLIYWVNALTSRSATAGIAQAVHVSDWQTATLVTWIRLLTAHRTNTLVTWPLWTIPLAGFTFSTLYFYRRAKEICWKTITPILLCFSLGTSNYGWIFDQSVLVVCQMAVVCALYDLSDRVRIFTALFLLVCIQAVSISCSAWLDLPQHYYVWVPWAYALTLWLTVKREKLTPGL
jgi:hypothetical protein